MKTRNILKTATLAVLLALAATGAKAVTNTWTSFFSGNWNDPSNWDTLPLNNGTADIVLTNLSAATVTATMGEDWSINSLSFTGGGGFMPVGQSGTRTLTIGAGGITADRQAAERWLFIYPKITFTSADVTIGKTAAATWGSIDLNNTIDSTAVGGTRIHALTGYNGGEIRFEGGAASTTNISWSLENSRLNMYTEPTVTLGSNKMTIGWTGTRTADRSASIGLYRPGTLTNSASYFDTPLEFDPLSVGQDSGLNLRPVTLTAGKIRTDGGAFTQYVRGVWTSKGSVAVTNNQGDGWFQFRGVSADANQLTRTCFQQNSSGLIVNPIATPGWNGDVKINGSQYTVIDAPHAFGTNNSWAVNIGMDNGGLTTERDRYFLATAGNDYNGSIRLYGGGSVSNSAGQTPGTVIRGRAFIGLEGTGTVTFFGPLVLYTQADGTASYNNTGKETICDAYLYARPGGTAIFAGNISTNSWLSTGNPKVFITGGGTNVLEGSGSYTGLTTVQSNTTLRLDGVLASKVVVDIGSTVQGTGTIYDDLTVSGDVAPGDSIGTLFAASNVKLNSGAYFTAEIGALNASDLLDVSGNLDIGGAILRLRGTASGTFTIASYFGSLTGTFASIDVTGLGGNILDPTYGTGGINYGDGSADSITLSVIPEPASILLLLSGFVGAYKLRRRV